MRNFPGAPTFSVFQVWDNDVTFLPFAFSNHLKKQKGTAALLPFEKAKSKKEPTNV